MTLLYCVAYFFGGVFFVNALPHFLSGLTGRAFPSPFASPPGKGLSSPKVNVAWALVNLLVAYLLVFKVGMFDPRDIEDAACFGAGGAVIAFFLAHHFGNARLP